MLDPGPDVESLRRASALLTGRARDIEAIAGSLAAAGDPEAQLIQLGAMLESVRAGRRALDDLVIHIAEAAMARGAGPRFLDWSDATER